MNLVYGEIIDLGEEDGMRIGNLRIAGAIKKVPLDLIREARVGDKLLLCDGVAIGKVQTDSRIANYENHVSGNSR